MLVLTVRLDNKLKTFAVDIPLVLTKELNAERGKRTFRSGVIPTMGVHEMPSLFSLVSEDFHLFFDSNPRRRRVSLPFPDAFLCVGV